MPPLPPPSTYTCYRTDGPILVDGRLDESSWQKAPWLGPFVDMEHGTPVEYDTRVAFLWDDVHFYTAFRCEEPDVYGYETKEDGGVGGDCEVEVFILGEGNYYELEMNALNTIYEVFFTWIEPLVAQQDMAALDRLFAAKRYGYAPIGDTYPRRHGSFDWNFPGFQHAVQIHGTLNQPQDEDEGWTVELAFPWEGMKRLAGRRAAPPNDGDTWQVGCSRVEHWRDRTTGQVLRGRDWSICPHGKIAMHIPDRWPYVRFDTRTVGT